jgi:transposase InsO family protein
MNAKDPIFLQTDASDYGVGAYLFQLSGDVEKPTAFLSKSLTDIQTRWSVPERECYAIFWAIQELDYLVSGRHFTLQTDHQNLTFLNTGTSPKVQRWKLAIQTYDFDIEHIPGEENIIADSLSRLCEEVSKTSSLLPPSAHQLLALEAEEQPSSSSSSSKTQFSTPPSKHKLISKVHNATAGHHGVEKTLEKLTRQGYNWLHMRSHVKYFILQCPCCQKASFTRPPINTHPFTVARYEPFERLYWDTIGPLPTDDKGNTYIIVIICAFTRFVELYSVPDTSAMSAATSLFDLLGRYGAPCQLVNDNGTQFVNSVISELLKLVGTEQIMTTAYSKEENSLVERANKEVMRHVRAIIYHNNVKTKWSDNKPLVMRIINATKSDLTNYAPAEMLYGNAISLDRGIFLPHDARHDDVTINEWVDQRLKAQTAIFTSARKIMQDNDLQHMSSKGNNVPTNFEINSYVLAQYPYNGMREGPPEKYKLFWRGPFRVVSFVQDKYKLLNLTDNSEFELHVKQLKQFRYDPVNTDPRLIALKDRHLFDIEKIIEHSGLWQHKSKLKFRIRWAGYDSNFDLWLPWDKDLSHDPALHAYLRIHKMQKLIPKKDL